MENEKKNGHVPPWLVGITILGAVGYLLYQLTASPTAPNDREQPASKAAPGPDVIAAQISADKQASRAPQIKPESLVRFENGTMACLDRESLRQAVEHAVKGEKTKLNALMAGKGGDCTMIPPTKTVRVIAAEYNDPNIDIGLLEIVGKDTQSGNGAWAFSAGAHVVNE